MAAWKTPPIRTLTRFAVTREASDLPGVDPLDELRARRLHRDLGGDDLDGVDGHEVVAVLVGGDALVEVAHLDVVRAPRALPGERLHLDALEGSHDPPLGRPLPPRSVAPPPGGLSRLHIHVRL